MPTVVASFVALMSKDENGDGDKMLQKAEKVLLQGWRQIKRKI